MIELTEQQRQELASPEPLAIDPQTQETYVLVRREAYERLKSLLADDILATGNLVDAVMAEDDAKDPHLAEYQRLFGGKP
jgi:hypothetical protein